MRQFSCENGHSFTSDLLTMAVIGEGEKDLPCGCPPGTKVKVGENMKNEAPWHPSDDDPKWDEGDPTANY